MRPEDREQIRQLNIFEGMDDENFDELIRASYLQTFPAQMELISLRASQRIFCIL